MASRAAARKLATVLRPAIPSQGIDALRLEMAVVQSATNAGQVSGRAALCTVTWLGENYPATYPASYTPVVGHVVLVAVQPPQTLMIIHEPHMAP